RQAGRKKSIGYEKTEREGDAPERLAVRGEGGGSTGCELAWKNLERFHGDTITILDCFGNYPDRVVRGPDNRTA
ncbi:hypothetical protein, partial [Aeromonas salmonicida]|uniref:hypothetical protein n=1 Tax=Aeromonas salmonicida TaxID=645 RepID=UPI00223EB321